MEMTEAERYDKIESELREIKTMLRLLVPTYGDMKKRTDAIFGFGKADVDIATGK
jgi:hypothetical protein